MNQRPLEVFQYLDEDEKAAQLCALRVANLRRMRQAVLRPHLPQQREQTPAQLLLLQLPIPWPSSCKAHSIQQVGANLAVAQDFATKLRDVPFLKAILAIHKSHRPARHDNAEKLLRHRAKLEMERQRLLRAHLRGLCAEDDYEREFKRIEADLRSLDGQPVSPLPEIFDAAEIVKAITRWFAGFAEKPFEKRRATLQAAIKDIVMEDGALTSTTVNGAFLAMPQRANSSPRLRSRCWCQYRALVPRLPQW